MSKPDDIEQDVWDDAHNLAMSPSRFNPKDEYSLYITDLVARAILSERTKAAEIAESYYDKANEAWVDTGAYADKDAADMLLELSQAIRKGGKE